MIELARRLGKEKHDTSKQEGQDGPGVAPLSFPVVWYSIKEQDLNH